MSAELLTSALDRRDFARARRIGRILGRQMDGASLRAWGRRCWLTRPTRVRELMSEALRPANNVPEQLALDAAMWRSIRRTKPAARWLVLRAPG